MVRDRLEYLWQYNMQFKSDMRYHGELNDVIVGLHEHRALQQRASEGAVEGEAEVEAWLETGQSPEPGPDDDPWYGQRLHWEQFWRDHRVSDDPAFETALRQALNPVLSRRLWLRPC